MTGPVRCAPHGSIRPGKGVLGAAVDVELPVHAATAHVVLKARERGPWDQVIFRACADQKPGFDPGTVPLCSNEIEAAVEAHDTLYVATEASEFENGGTHQAINDCGELGPVDAGLRDQRLAGSLH